VLPFCRVRQFFLSLVSHLRRIPYNYIRMIYYRLFNHILLTCRPSTSLGPFLGTADPRDRSSYGSIVEKIPSLCDLSAYISLCPTARQSHRWKDSCTTRATVWACTTMPHAPYTPRFPRSSYGPIGQMIPMLIKKSFPSLCLQSPLWPFAA
jgi:hypothetical protein